MERLGEISRSNGVRRGPVGSTNLPFGPELNDWGLGAMDTNSIRIVRFLMVASVMTLSGCLLRPENSIRADLTTFAELAAARQATDSDRLSQAVAVSAIVALDIHRQSHSWPKSQDAIVARVAHLHPQAWLEEQLGGIDIVPSDDPNAISFVSKGTRAVLATIWTNGRMSIPLASPLLKPESGGESTQLGKRPHDLIDFLLEQLSSPIVK